MTHPDQQTYVERFNRSLVHLFYLTGKFSRFNPAQSLFWIRTYFRQKQKSITRKHAAADNLVVPPVLIYSVTTRCNLQCKGCYASTSPGMNRPELSMKRVRSLFQEASELGVGVIMIAGGEPLMKPEILRIAAEYRDLVVPVFTNGMLLNQKNISFFKKHRNLIPILSAEGGRHRTDDRRGNGVYKKLIGNMEQLQKTDKMFGMSITLTRRNFSEVTHPVWLRSHHRLGCRLFFLVDYVPQSETDMDLCLTGEQKQALPAKIEILRKQVPALFISLPGDEEKYGGCLAAGRGFIHVSASGDLEPCPFAPYSDINLRENGLRQALQSAFIKTIRNSHHLLGEAKGGCTLWENRIWVQSQLKEEMARPAYW